ncbi:hypothetical protein HD806DRAFT_497489 [Xylariaceae sp. AK1471]|nr:hypothetical protein HD806DRAFT_497489 [Xylariaceae sp. AK1471]
MGKIERHSSLKATHGDQAASKIRTPPISRRAHNKSRRGCSLCRTRKIKCDERQPCSYCIKKDVKCSLQNEPRISLQPASFRHEQDLAFSISDFSLFQHFIKRVSFDHSDDAASAFAWSNCVADLATRHAYLLHNLLAISALHLRSMYPEQAETFERIAREHQARGIPLFREAITRDLDETPLPIFACASLLLPAHFAASRDPLSLILNEEKHSSPDWLQLLDGTTSIIIKHVPFIMGTPLNALLGPMKPMNLDDIDDSPADRELINLKDTIPVETERRDAYGKLIDILRFFFTLSNRGPSMFDRKTAALRFPTYFGMTARDDLARRYPAALVVMAFWLVLLFRMQDRWWLRGKVQPIALKIQQLLPNEHKHLIVWPLGQLGIHCNDAQNS